MQSGEEKKPGQAPVVEGGGTSDQAKPAKSALRETLETVVVALLITLLIRSFLVQLYVVDGASMLPTLHHGDRLLVNKIGYRFGEPKPGEIVVVEDPQNPRRQLIKRVVAVAGESIEVRNHVVFIDGKPLEEPYANLASIHYTDMGPREVPPGYIFVMGDNRGGSLDSRVLGPMPVEKVQGKAFFLFWPPARFNNHAPLQAPRTFK